MPIMIFMTSYFPDPERYNRFALKSTLKKNLLAMILTLGIVVISSCSENSTTIGINLLPEADFTDLVSTDTVVPRAYNFTYDSVVSSGQANLYLGGLYDQYFGNTFCDFAAQLRLTQKWPGGVPTVDSVKLYLSVSGAKGDHTTDLALKMYELSEQLYIDSTYYSDKVPKTGMFLGSYDIGVFEKDTTKSLSTVLPNSIGQYMLRDTSMLYQDASSNSDFKSYFKGLYVTVGQGGAPARKGSVPDIPTLLVINTATDNFLIRVFYHTQTSSNAVYYDFLINDKCARFNRYMHDLSTANPEVAIKHINDNVMDSITCVQTFYGVSGKIKFTGLEAYKKLMPLSVNKARLVYNVFLDGVDYKATTVPSKIYLAYKTSDGKMSLVPDYYVNANFYGGAFSSSSSTYSFNLAAFVQEYLDGTIPEPELQMYLPEGEYQNAILKSVGSTKPPTFTLVYTKY